MEDKMKRLSIDELKKHGVDIETADQKIDIQEQLARDVRRKYNYKAQAVIRYWKKHKSFGFFFDHTGEYLIGMVERHRLDGASVVVAIV
jgi:hypothetical protein